jgi:nickel-dependent lactate racemase
LAVWRLADGASVWAQLHGVDRAVTSVAVGALPDGTPVIVSGRLAATFSLLICAEEGRAGHERVAWSGRLTHRLLDLGHALP